MHCNIKQSCLLVGTAPATVKAQLDLEDRLQPVCIITMLTPTGRCACYLSDITGQSTDTALVLLKHAAHAHALSPGALFDLGGGTPGTHRQGPTGVPPGRSLIGCFVRTTGKKLNRMLVRSN